MFDKLLNEANLADFIQTNSDIVFEFGNSNYDQLKNEKLNLETFILLDFANIQLLDFNKIQNRAFLFLLYDLCERLELSAGMQLLWHLLQESKINTGSRLLAANLFSFNIAEAPQYIDIFDEICSHLKFAIENEEDDDKKVLATFANYYTTVLGRQTIWIQKLKEKIIFSKDNYPFLSNNFISTLLSFDTINYEECINNIQNLKDKLFGRKRIEITLQKNESLIEQGQYANQIINISNITFNDIRQIAFNSVKAGLKLDNRGVSPLNTVEEMFIYLKNYGKMHFAKMMSAIENIPIEQINKNIDIIDWGCGQALATIVLMEYLNNNGINFDPNVILIEPSEIAIKRAALHTKTFNNNAEIKTICKYLDDISEKDIATDNKKIKIHLFSNILDIELFSISQLEELISNSQKGTNYFVCVSPYINDLKTDRVDSFKRYFENNYSSTFEMICEETNSGKLDDIYWNCNNNYNDNMNGRFCPYPHPTCGCNNKWTRVIRVFKVEL